MTPDQEERLVAAMERIGRELGGLGGFLLLAAGLVAAGLVVGAAQ